MPSKKVRRKINAHLIFSLARFRCIGWVAFPQILPLFPLSHPPVVLICVRSDSGHLPTPWIRGHSMSLFNQTKEWLPDRHTLRRRAVQSRGYHQKALIHGSGFCSDLEADGAVLLLYVLSCPIVKRGIQWHTLFSPPIEEDSMSRVDPHDWVLYTPIC